MSDQTVTAAFRAAVGNQISDEALAAELDDLRLDRFLTADGTVDTAKVRRHATTMTRPTAPRSGDFAGDWLRRRGYLPGDTAEPQSQKANSAQNWVASDRATADTAARLNAYANPSTVIRQA